ncbi:hypothetical protein HY844_01840 [Candidatus Berkelbacteria bacterium]|nr:hypothetical protein [Candidatus Berkelbacteria bacterium]
MKPIYLAPDDEITSVVEKITALSDQKLALVAPKNSNIFQSLINLKLLKKEATRLDKEIVIITTSKVGQKLAEQVGIKSYSNISSVGISDIGRSERLEEKIESEVLPDGTKIHQYNPSETVEKNDEVISETTAPQEQKNDDDEEEGEEESVINKKATLIPEFPPIKIATPIEKSPADELPAISGAGFSTRTEFNLPWRSLIGAILILFIAFIALFVFLPKAYISATFPSTKVDTKVALNVLTEGVVGENDIEGVNLSASKSATKTIKATGKKDIGTKATGSITITNKYKDGSGVGKDQSFSALTKVTDTKTGKVFTLNNAVTIGRVTYDPNNGQPIYQSKTVGVTAIEPGESYNISTSTFNITGALSGVTAQSTTSFKGGLTKQVTVLSQSDIDNVQKELKEKTNTEILVELKTKAENKQFINSAVSYQVIKESVDKKVGDQTDEATATYEVTASVIAFDQETLKQKVVTALSKDIKQNEELVLNDKTFENIKSTNDPAKKSVKLELQASGNLTIRIEKDKMAKAITNKTSDQISQILKDSYSATDVKVDISPSWWFKRSPMFSWAIKIEPVFK